MNFSPFALLPGAVRRLAVAAAFAAVAASPAAAADPLVSAEWLNSHRADANLIVIDIRSAIDGGGAKAYAEAHVPGAIHSDYNTGGWRVTRNGVPAMVPEVPALEKLIGGLGIGNDSHVVVVPAGVNVLDFGAAARVYWTLKYAGVADVSILDGGVTAWKAVGLPVESGVKVPTPATFAAKPDTSILIEAPQVLALQKKGVPLVDARPASYFHGKEKHPASLSYGRIPGAQNIDSATFYDPAANRLKPKDELAKLAGDVPAGEAVVYCNTGHWAATDWFVLHEVLGRTEAKLYAASMVEWTRDPSRPLASERTKWDDIKEKLGL